MSTLSDSDIEKIATAIGKKSQKQEWLKHPLLLLFMSLIFTTIAGTALTTVIKNVDFKKRQLLLKQEKVLEQKIRIIGELNQESLEQYILADSFREKRSDNRRT